MFSLSNCSKFARRSPYTEAEMENYLEETYDEEFSVISREEIYDSYTGALQYIDYEICHNDTGTLFNARDKYDGAFAGYGVYDDFEEVIGTDVN